MKHLEKEISSIPALRKEINKKKGMPLPIEDLYNVSKYQIFDIDFILDITHKMIIYNIYINKRGDLYV